METEFCLLRIGRATWFQLSDGSRCIVDEMDLNGAKAFAAWLGVPLRILDTQSQAGFACDVAQERFGLTRPHLGLWFTATTGTPVWARY